MSRFRSSRVTALMCLFAGGLAGLPAPAQPTGELNWFEWAGVAPVVVAGEAIGESGKHTVFEVSHSFRGKILPGGRVLINVREMNRSRNRDLHRKGRRLPLETPYVVLLEPSSKRQGEHVVYSVVRGIRGARALPPEGSRAVLDALASFIAIQDAKSERYTWESLRAMLEEGNPIVLQTAVEQFTKFQRGVPELSLSLVPLLAHPQDGLRERVVRLLGQIVHKYDAAEIPEEQGLRGELYAVARRDSSIAVRRAACQALDGFSGKSVEVVLQEVAAKDPDQSVRLEAEKLLYRRRNPPNR